MPFATPDFKFHHTLINAAVYLLTNNDIRM